MRSTHALALVLGLPLALASAPRLIAAAAAPDPEARLEDLSRSWAAGGPPETVLEMRAINPEYDLMSRTFLVLALADRALAEVSPEAEQQEALAVMDAVIADTLARTRAEGHRHWLLGYADARPWRGEGRSLFVDGELLVMVGARRMVRDDRWQAETRELAAAVVGNLGSASALPVAESYPDEGWTFCHAMAHLGLRLHEVLDGAEHAVQREAFLAWARDELREPTTRLLASEFALDGTIHDGPEGSSIWFVVAVLAVLDPELGAEQYALAREELGGSVLGLGYAREWPASAAGFPDVDSGPIVPFIDASASSSGLALAASRIHGDTRWHGQLVAALGAAELVLLGLPRLAEMADNPVGQAVVAWGTGAGPLFELVSSGGTPAGSPPREPPP